MTVAGPDLTGQSNTSRTYPVAELLLRSARGPAVIEVAFDNGGIGSEKVTSAHELDPDDASALPARDREPLARAFAERGGIPVPGDPPAATSRSSKSAPARRPRRPEERSTATCAWPCPTACSLRGGWQANGPALDRLAADAAAALRRRGALVA